MVCHHPMHILNPSFVLLFTLGYNKGGKYLEFCMSYSDETWYVGSSKLKYYPCALLSQMCIFNTSFAYLFWLAYSKKGKPLKLSMATVTKLNWYSMWEVVDSGITQVSRCHWMCIVNFSFAYVNTSYLYSDWLITKKVNLQSASWHSQKVAHTVYSVNIENAWAKNCKILVSYALHTYSHAVRNHLMSFSLVHHLHFVAEHCRSIIN